ncbi:MAG: hypothetical protein H0T85_06140 [Geodermatophilaceae bacterium]|nr:hypothetical protein [Geodermatophilaceae bacterium]
MTEIPTAPRPARAVRSRAVPGVAVAGTAAYAPDRGARVVDNDEVVAVIRRHGGEPLRAEWVQAMGVQRRLWTCVPGEVADDDAATTDAMLAGAIDAAVADAGLSLGDVDLVIAATTTTSRLTTSMASVATGHLGLRCATMELRAGCASGAYGLATAYAQLAVGAEVVVVAAAETLSKVAPGVGPAPYLAGDGAAAVVLTRSDDTGRGLLASWLSGDGTLSALAGPPGALPPRAADLAADRYRLVMDRRFDEAAAPWWPVGPIAVLEQAGVPAADIRAMLMNQANRVRITETAATVGVEPDALVDIVGETANAGAASMLIALDRARRDGRATDGATVLVAGVGGGLGAGALALRV